MSLFLSFGESVTHGIPLVFKGLMEINTIFFLFFKLISVLSWLKLSGEEISGPVASLVNIRYSVNSLYLLTDKSLIFLSISRDHLVL